MKIKAGIIGGAGYTGGELLRLLIHHPDVEIAFVHSNSNAGNLISDVHTDVLGDTDLKFSDNEALKSISAESSLENLSVLFLCVGHGDAKKFLEANAIHSSIKIIDLSQDFRLVNNTTFSQLTTHNSSPRPFVYGLPELNRDTIQTAQNIANPGCFATCIQLGLLPLASKGLLKSEIHVNATTGSTGAGQSLSATSHFTWRNNNLSVYKAFEHQHLHEISQSLTQLRPDFFSSTNTHATLSPLERAGERLLFIPQRGDFTRGIFAAMYTDCDLTLAEAENLYQNYYASHPFTHISKKSIDLKQVVNTNKCIIHLEKHGKRLFITSIIDNLLKGASGQAVQNMNLMFGLDEWAGLRLKAAGF